MMLSSLLPVNAGAQYALWDWQSDFVPGPGSQRWQL